MRPAAPARAALIGVGNPFRRDDGAGLEAVARLRGCALPDVTVTVVDGEPTGLLEAWSGASLAVVVDTVVCDPPTPGRIHRVTAPTQLPGRTALATHGMGVVDAIRLAAALDRLPTRLVLIGVEAADVGVGVGLSPEVAAAIPALVRAARAELGALPPRYRVSLRRSSVAKTAASVRLAMPSLWSSDET